MAFPPLNLSITKKVANRKKDGVLYRNLGDSFTELSQFQDAIDSYQQYLRISIEQGDKAGEGQAYGKLGNACNSIGRNDEAKDYYERQLCIAIKVGEKVEERKALNNLGTLFYCLGNFEKASENHKKHLHIAIELGDRSGEGYALSYLGNTFHRLGSLTVAMEYHERSLTIFKELGDRVGEEKAYGNLGRVYRSLGDFKNAIKYHKLQLRIAKEEGMRADEACASYELGCSSESEGSEMVALEYYKSSARLFEEIRADLPRYQTNSFKDEWKINLFDVYQCVYTALCRIYLNLNMTLEALFAAEKGRSQALLDFLISHYGANLAQILSCEQEEAMSGIMKYISSDTIVLALDNNKINIWLLQPGKVLQFKSRSMEGADDVMSFWSMMDGMPATRSCEVSRSVEDSGDEEEKELSPSTLYRLLFDFVFGPISDYFQGNELIIVPVGPLCLVPFAASIDPVGRYLCESFRIRIVPSLTTLKVIADSPQGYHSESGALVVGDPEVPRFMFRGRWQEFSRLPYARKEIEMIGQLIKVKPLIGKEATKEEVLEQLSAVALVHLATHGDIERGEVILAPSSRRNSRTLEEKDCILTMADVLNTKVRAKLVVLSCCHSGRGKISSEGVVGIARAFLAAGARSVLVALWAIDDEATLSFMSSFYQHLVQGRSSSEAVNKATKYMRESDKFNKIRDWSPFQLIGDDITIKFLNEPDIVSGLKLLQCGIIMRRIYNKVLESECLCLFIIRTITNTATSVLRHKHLVAPFLNPLLDGDVYTWNIVYLTYRRLPKVFKPL